MSDDMKDIGLRGCVGCVIGLGAIWIGFMLTGVTILMWRAVGV